jgi:hypothetical protein
MLTLGGQDKLISLGGPSGRQANQYHDIFWIFNFSDFGFPPPLLCCSHPLKRPFRGYIYSYSIHE